MSDTSMMDAALPPPPPLGDPAPCGPDLEANFDADFMNVVARLQGEFPASYLSYVYPASEEDRVTIDFPAAFRELAAVTSRTHDLRLLSLRARFELLQGDLPAFGTTLQLMAGLLEAYWDEVYPRKEGDTMELRRNELAALDSPVVSFAMQYAPVYESRRVGAISVRALMYAQGKAKPREGEKAESERTLADALAGADDDEIEPVRDAVEGSLDAVDRIRAKWAASDDDTPPLDKLREALLAVRGLLALGKPVAAAAPAEADAGQDGPSAAAPVPGAAPAPGAVASHAQAGAALQGLAAYFARAEPSNPALPLIDQAVELKGKSLYQALKALMPKQADQASFKIGNHAVFDLALSTAEGAKQDRTAVDDAEEPPEPRFIATRREAVAVMGTVIAFYRVNEPSSPVPWLLERASHLVERDFMSLLADVLPKNALRDAEKA